MNDEQILAAAKETAVRAGRKVMEIYATDFAVKYKDDTEPVTKADLAANRIIISDLEKFGYPVLSEESVDDASRLKTARVWIVDPMDGTRDFINKTGDFSIMIGLVENGRPILGVVYKPDDEAWYWGLRGSGAWKETKNGRKRLSVSANQSIKEAGILLSRFHLSADVKKLVQDLGIGQEIPAGSLGLKLGYIAEQIGDITVNTSSRTSEWDICAADIILSEAGGVLTDMGGNEFTYNRKDPRNLRGLVATNKHLHSQILEYLN